MPPKRTQESQLAGLSEDLLFEIHQQVDSSKRAEQIQINECKSLGAEGSNQVLRLGYKSFAVSFINGEYECTVVLDSKKRLVEVRDIKSVY